MTTRRSFLGLLGAVPVAAVAIAVGAKSAEPEPSPTGATVGIRIRSENGPWVMQEMGVPIASGNNLDIDGFWIMNPRSEQ